MTGRNTALTPYGWVVCLWVLAISFQYGYHVAALNQIQAVLTCKSIQKAYVPSNDLSTCIHMSDATFSFVTSIFTIGGLLGSLGSKLVNDSWGRKGAARTGALSIAFGAGLMGLSHSVAPFAIGRLFVGVGAGFGLCAAPVFVAEITPAQIKGRVGVLTQLSIVIGILVSQGVGFAFATPTQWRRLLFISSCIAISQLIFSPFIVESPVWLGRRGALEEQRFVVQKLWSNTSLMQQEASRSDAEDPLLEDMLDDRSPSHMVNATVLQVLRASELRGPMLIISLAMLTQQISGINAIMYYSNNILAKTLPESGPHLSLLMSAVNCLMTFPAIILIDRIGQRSLLQFSITGILISLLAVGLGLNNGYPVLTSIAIITFIMSFALGLGPVPFILIPEVSPTHAVSALSSIGLSMNWTVNFCVGLIFLPLRNLLSSNDPTKEGRVFYMFAAMMFATAFSLFRVFKG